MALGGMAKTYAERAQAAIEKSRESGSTSQQQAANRTDALVNALLAIAETITTAGILATPKRGGW